MLDTHQRRASCCGSTSRGRSFVENHHPAMAFQELLPVHEKGLREKASLHDNLIVHGNLAALKSPFSACQEVERRDGGRIPPTFLGCARRALALERAPIPRNGTPRRCLRVRDPSARFSCGRRERSGSASRARPRG